MYHFKITEHAPERTVLNEHTELSGCAIKFLKDFQISAVRFLFEQFCKRDFSILNDESGLGKTASVAVFLGIVAVQKNCLIIISNNDDCVTGWRFHLDILTDLKVSVLKDEKDYDATTSSVYIIKWNTLRAIGDLSKFHFDLIVVDNRELILNNTFCISSLLKNFEKKVQLVISSADVTSDVKLMHNILRLGGRLEHQLESFRAFEQKFKLPDLKEISSRKSDLEDYFLRREILNDYCRDFRLRRYRHQIEDTFPLVDSERYKMFLNEWQAATCEKTTNVALINNVLLPFENSTEELLEQYQTSSLAKTLANDNIKSKTVSEAQNTMYPSPTAPAPLDITDDLMDMPPLVFVSDSEDDTEEEDVIFLSSESAEAASAAIPVIEIVEEEEENTSDKSERCQTERAKVKIEKTSPKSKENIKTREKNKRKCGTPQKIKTVETTTPTSPQLNTVVTTRSTRRSFGNCNAKKTNSSSTQNTTPVSAKRKEQQLQQKLKETTPTQLKSKQSSTKERNSLEMKAEKLTPKKNDQNVEKTKKTQNVAMKIENTQKVEEITPEKPKKMLSTTKNEIKDGNKTPQNTTKKPTEARHSHKRVSTPLVGVPLRDTRNMQRQTRSTGGNRKCFALDFDDDNKKTKVKSKSKQTVATEKAETPKNVVKSKINEKTQKTVKAKSVEAATTSSSKQVVSQKQITKTKQQTPTQANTRTTRNSLPTTKRTTTTEKSQSSAATTTTNTNTNKSRACRGKTISRLQSTQSSALSTSSDYEEIQCGQKLSYSSSNDNSPQLLAKQNEFLMPSTPPSYRARSLRLISNDSDSDVALLSSATASQTQRKRAADAVIVLSSSHDEASLSSQASSSNAAEQRKTVAATVAIGTQKRKRYSKRVSLPVADNNKDPITFTDLLVKQRKTTKSPDLFSVGSSGGVLTQGSSNVIPFTQPNGKAPAATPSTTITTTSPIFGFKIFGSEVRSLQQPTTTDSERQLINARPKRNARSCLNILEQMFEKNPKTTQGGKKPSAENIKAKDLRVKLRHVNRTANPATGAASGSTRKRPLANNESSTQQLSQPTPRKPIHSRSQQQQQQITGGDSNDIFEITNNATFGSTLRISTSGGGGHVSPVTTLPINNSNQYNHNKITNYLIGNGTNAGVANEQIMLATPSGIANSIASTQTRKSPKSAKSTQTTKLTKWFRRSSVEESNSCPNRNANKTINEGSKSAKLIKRRRLDLSFKS